MGIGDWGLGIGGWGMGPIPNPHFKKIYFILFFVKRNRKQLKNKNI